VKTYHDARMGLPDDEMHKLTSSGTDRISEPPCGLPPPPRLRVRGRPLPAGCSPAVSAILVRL
jgi:hypothetical protein